ncbi:MAG TPA: phytanoyl-CoA dioxygenase family protein [Acidimicrobiales bacterium]|nr:phytanoyl-CoA dioxygenase family protein [Acidimicrobiales bacterium]
MDETEVAHFGTFGFVVLRQAVDPVPLSDEVDRSLRDAGSASFAAEVDGGTIAGRYVPMMAEHTPVSLSLLDRFADVAASLLGRSVLPVRAKGVLYFGGSAWHNDSGRGIGSVGFACYLERLDSAHGALRVLPGSHRPEFGRAVQEFASHQAAGGLDAPGRVPALPGYPVETEPGDVIVFDEHLYHASAGGRERRQWRVDYVIDAVGTEEEAEARAYYAGVFPADWDGGYDVDRFPSYGPHWLASGRPSVSRLGQLGVYEAAGRQEAYARSQRRSAR